MKLSEQLKQCNESGDFGQALAGYAERAEELERDAERYRWLKARGGAFHGPEVFINGSYALGSDIDAAIDAEMRKTL